MTAQPYETSNWLTDDGTPDGGEAIGPGFHINWQRGALVVDGVERPANGAFVETILAVCIDRMRHYQDTKFACRENALAITHMEEAAHWLEARQARRGKAAIAGTHQTMSGERGADG